MKCLIFNFLNWLFSRIGIPLDDIFVTHVWVECRVSRTGYGVPDDNADLAHSRWKTRYCLEIESFWSRWKRFPTSEAIPWTPSMVHLWDYFWTARKNFHRKGAHEKSRKYWMLLVPRNPQNQTEKKGWKIETSKNAGIANKCSSSLFIDDPLLHFILSRRPPSKSGQWTRRRRRWSMNNTLVDWMRLHPIDDVHSAPHFSTGSLRPSESNVPTTQSRKRSSFFPFFASSNWTFDPNSNPNIRGSK